MYWTYNFNVPGSVNQGGGGITCSGIGQSFDGNDYAVYDDNGELDIVEATTDFCFAMVVKTGSDITTLQNIGGKNVSALRDGRYGYSLNGSALTTLIDTDGGNTQISSSGVALAINTEYHLFTRIDLANSKIYFYVDGVLQNAGGTSFTGNFATMANTYDFLLGCGMDSGGNKINYFTGYIRDVRIWHTDVTSQLTNIRNGIETGDEYVWWCLSDADYTDLTDGGRDLTFFFSVNLAKGTVTGSNADIYKNELWVTGAEDYFTTSQIETPAQSTDASKKYFAQGWADFFTPEDPQIMLALNTKYGTRSSFYRQIKPLTDDVLNEKTYDRTELRMIEKQGSWDGNHQFLHIGYTYAYPLYDGRTTPTNDELRADRGNGTNAFNHDINDTLDNNIGSIIRSWWWRLDATIGGTNMSALTNEQCDTIRKAVGVFGMPIDGQNQQEVLETMDILSERYCGTTGKSVYDNDYSARVPNTLDGLEPSIINRIQGGIFQGAASTQNHEIWERVLQIDEEYKKEFDGKNKKHIFWTTPGGCTYTMAYHKQGRTNGRFADSDLTKLWSGVNKYESSINGNTRSLQDLCISLGYKLSMATQGQGYGQILDDGLDRLEIQRIFQKNASLKNNNNVGDGYINSIRTFQNLYTATDVTNALASSDVVKYLYDLNSTDGRWSALSAYTPTSNIAEAINEIVKLNAWGTIPEGVGDSGANADTQVQSSMAMGQEALLQFFKAAEIELISHEEAYDLAYNNEYTPANWFPNPTFETLVKDITASANAPEYPDGWNGGIIVDDSGTAYKMENSGNYYIRQYAIKPGTYTYSVLIKGSLGDFIIKKIKNKDVYDDTANFEVIATHAINDVVNYVEVTGSFTIEDAAMEVYGEPADEDETAYQNYMKGYGNKICGIQIEIEKSAGLSYPIHIKTPSIIMNI